jgi:N-acylneuraminate cytidylyltransferase
MDSKRFPGKCLALLDGKPLLQHTIDFARTIDIPLYTFTRDQRIIDYVKDKTPIIYEPIELYDTPQNTTYEKMQYVNRILDADYVILLQPTQPVRFDIIISRLIKELRTSVCSNLLDDCLYSTNMRGVEDGAFYFYSKKYLNRKSNNLIPFTSGPVSFDIDTPEDLKECEEWLQAQKRK